MSIQEKSRLWHILIAVHLCKLLLLFVIFVNESPLSWYYFFSLKTWYLMFFLIDLILVFVYWFMKPMWEEGVRVFGFFWNIAFVVFTWGIYQLQFVLVVFYLSEMCILAWPKQYQKMPEEGQPVNDADDSFRVKCIHCNAVYVYLRQSENDGGVLCQNCGKLIKI